MVDQQGFDIFEHYKLQKILATKETSSTYLAGALAHTQHQVVVKVFNRAYLHPQEDYKKSEAYFKNLLSLHHRWIVPLLDIVFSEKQLYLVHPYLAHGSLREHLQNLSSKRMMWEEALITILKIGQALAYAHTHAITHASIKPENVLYSDRDDVMLGDFSLTPAVHFSTLTTPIDLLAASYMAPERFMGTTHHLSDQYALACLAYELFIGHPPFEAQKLTTMWNKHANEDPVPLSILAPYLPDSVARAITKALAKDPYQRYPDMSTFLLELEHGSNLLPLHTAMKQEPDRLSYAVEINTSLTQKATLTTTRNEDHTQTGTTFTPLPATPTPLFARTTAPLPDPNDETMTMFTVGEPAHLTQTPLPTVDSATAPSRADHRQSSHTTADLIASPSSTPSENHGRFRQPLFWITLLLIAFTITLSLASLLFDQQNTLSAARAGNIHPQSSTVTSATRQATTHAASHPSSQSTQVQKSQHPAQSTTISRHTPTPGPTPSSTGHAPASHVPTAIQTPAIASAGNVDTRINAGGGPVGNFVADTDYVDPTGTPCDGTDHTIDTSLVSDPTPQAVYQDNRCAPYFTYTLSRLQPDSTYTVRLYFAETYWTQSGQRIFTVSINGQTVLSHFDIVAATGGPYRAIAEQFTAVSTDKGQITIAFSAIRDNALLSGLEVSR